MKYDKVKRVRTDDGDFIYLIHNEYDSVTGALREQERMFDPSMIDDRVVVLQEAIATLQGLKSRIGNKQFDEEVDKRE